MSFLPLISEQLHENPAARGYDQGIRLEPTCLAPKLSRFFETVVIQLSINKGADQTTRTDGLICAFVVRTWNEPVFYDVADLYTFIHML